MSSVTDMVVSTEETTEAEKATGVKTAKPKSPLPLPVQGI
jgi:hypothetical protein